jgi:phosphoribosyl 1,2-cyclic phosphate phosphodiesterase
MHFVYLGTGAAEGIPDMFCDCPRCQRAREKGGRYVHTRSQALINDELLLDFNADTYLHSLRRQQSFTSVKDILITHAHGDHFVPEEFEYLRNDFSHFHNEHVINVYLTDPAYSTLNKMFFMGQSYMTPRLAAHRIEPFQKLAIDGYEVYPLLADHAVNMGPVIYAIYQNGKGLLYAHDSGYFPESTFAFIEKQGLHFDFVSFDCTGGLNPAKVGADWYTNHMSFATVQSVAARLEKLGAITPKTLKVLSHFTHNARVDYDEMVAYCEPLGFRVAYDGLTFDF